MDVQLLHPESIFFPTVEIDWAQAEVFPIGVVKLTKRGELLPLAIAQLGRLRALVAFVDGKPVELDLAEAGPAFYAALDRQCEVAWGHSWNAALGEIFSLNRRTLQRDRVERYLLPPRVCMTLSYIFSADDSAQLAELLIAVSRYHAWRGTQGNRSSVEGYVLAGVTLFYEEDEIATMGLNP